MSGARAWLGAALLLGCAREGGGERVRALLLDDVPAPTSDPSDRCSDFGAARVCLSDACPDGLCVRPRPLPSELASLGDEFRCTGAGAARRCSPRWSQGSPFACHSQGCIQLRPRLPDDAEWECADLAGVVLCRGGTPAAGIAPSSPATGWFCGSRARKMPAERVCLDLDPDFPKGRRGSVSCQFRSDGAEPARVCLRGAGPRLGASCSGGSDCPGGASCREGFCVPERIAPSCWGDADCGVGTCVYGSCSEGPG